MEEKKTDREVMLADALDVMEKVMHNQFTRRENQPNPTEKKLLNALEIATKLTDRELKLTNQKNSGISLALMYGLTDYIKFRIEKLSDKDTHITVVDNVTRRELFTVHLVRCHDEFYLEDIQAVE